MGQDTRAVYEQIIKIKTSTIEGLQNGTSKFTTVAPTMNPTQYALNSMETTFQSNSL